MEVSTINPMAVMNQQKEEENKMKNETKRSFDSSLKHLSSNSGVKQQEKHVDAKEAGVVGNLVWKKEKSFLEGEGEEYGGRTTTNVDNLDWQRYSINGSQQSVEVYFNGPYYVNVNFRKLSNQRLTLKWKKGFLFTFPGERRLLFVVRKSSYKFSLDRDFRVEYGEGRFISLEGLRDESKGEKRIMQLSFGSDDVMAQELLEDLLALTI